MKILGGNSGKIFLLPALLFLSLSLTAASIITNPNNRTLWLGKDIEVQASNWAVETGIFSGWVKATNYAKEEKTLHIKVRRRNSDFYRKSITIPAKKTVNVPIYVPLINSNWYSLRIVLQEGMLGEEVYWTDYKRGYISGPDDCPLVRPQKTSVLKTDFRSYTPITTLRLDKEKWQKLPQDKKEAILDWVQLGGGLEISGADNALRQKIISNNPPISMCSAKKSDRSYGRGWISVRDKFKEEHGSFCPLTQEINFSPAPTWEVKLVSPYLFIPALVIFALLIGPGTIWWSRHKKNPALVLVLIPVISIISCLLLLLLSLFNDGIRPKISRQVISFLDQKQGKVITQQILGIEAPLGVRSPVEFPEKSIVYLTESLNSSEGYCVAEDGKIKLHSFVLPRTPTFFGMVKMEKSRTKLEVSKKPNGIQITNGLGSSIKSLTLRDEKGAFWEAKNIGAGQTIVLKPTDSPIQQFAEYGNTNIAANTLKASKELAPGCYQAYLESNVFGDNGIDGNRKIGENYNLLIGRYH